MLDLLIGLLEFDIFVSTPIEKSLLATKVLRDEFIMIRDKELLVDPILLNLKYFDIILGMDWLATYYILIDYFNKNVTLRIASQSEFCFEGSSIDIQV